MTTVPLFEEIAPDEFRLTAEGRKQAGAALDNVCKGNRATDLDRLLLAHVLAVWNRMLAGDAR